MKNNEIDSRKKAIICGISGQDGTYLAKYLLDKDYKVIGTSRDCEVHSFSNLIKIGIKEKIEIVSLSLDNFSSVLKFLDNYQPDEIYNLAGQSSVSFSFEQPIETFDSIISGTVNILEAVRYLNLNTKIYNAGSSECYGDTGVNVANEDSRFNPCSPYAVAKSSAFWITTNYRHAYKLYCCSGILFNHDSPLRPERFVTQKIIKAVCRISLGSNEKLLLGNLDIERDWGWAPEYVEAMWAMLQQEKAHDFVIATGKTYSLLDFVSYAFSFLNLDWKKFVEIDQRLCRPSDLSVSRANPSKAKIHLNWEANFGMYDVISQMISSELNNIK